MGFANVRLRKRLSNHSRSYDEGSTLYKIMSAKPTLRAVQTFAHAERLTFNVGPS